MCSFPKESWDALFEILGWRPDKQEAESIQAEVECFLTVYPLWVLAGKHRIRPSGVKRQLECVLDAAKALDAAMVNSTEFFRLEHSEDFQKA